MAELELLSALRDFLLAQPLSPTAALVGAVEPDRNADLPALVLSIEDSAPRSRGIGARSETLRGALATRAQIDLTNPVLASDPSFRLLNETRTVLTLPHGGLVRAEGDDPPLSAADIMARVGGNLRPFTSGAPTGQAFAVNAQVGTLTFGTALPGSGLVVVDYFLGSWERRIEHIAGHLRMDVCAANAADATAVSEQAVRALLAQTLPGLRAFSLLSLSAVGPRQVSAPNLRRRIARFAFDYEHAIDAPDSSGGVIREIPITTRLRAANAAASGEITETIVTEAS